MGLFNRRKEEVNPDVEKRSTVTSVTIESDESGYTMPMALGFGSLKNNNHSILNLSAGFAAIDLISNKIASIPIVVKTKEGDIVNHPFDHVFDNTLIGKYITMKQLVWDTLLYGNGICYIKRDGNGDAKALIYIPNGDYTICYNRLSQELYYLIPSITQKKIEPINVIHILKNSRDGINGKGVSFYAKKAIGLAGAADRAAFDYFDSGCAISGILKSTKPLSTQQKTDIKLSWNQAHVQGEPNGLAVLGNDLDFQQIGANSSESQLLESRKYSVRELARFLGIPPELIGDETNKAYNTLSEAINALIAFTLEPFISILEDEFNRKCLKPSERGRFFIDFKEEDLRMTDETAQAQALNSLVAGGIMTANEARKQLGLPEVDGGDTLKEEPQNTENQNDIIV